MEIYTQRRSKEYEAKIWNTRTQLFHRIIIIIIFNELNV